MPFLAFCAVFGMPFAIIRVTAGKRGPRGDSPPHIAPIQGGALSEDAKNTLFEKSVKRTASNG